MLRSFCEITVGVTVKTEGNHFKNIKTFYLQTGIDKKLFRKKFRICNKLIKCSLTTCINKLFNAVFNKQIVKQYNV